ncbi:MAG TPA: RidA family protein [Hypericibacter adhaerens]|jgi:enamine deaminase RidA (YjgF/YER057c/UK114 family)|uniref:RidA family protein n=1 Tax=Hypericibacter adhaerens TaxID=2602016 RepID=UPI002CEDE5CB|nr:RidA family protein [Hypericibacter adhaerens]HWA43242.1 RidA family protein [Hypericibacter adhaerens]
MTRFLNPSGVVKPFSKYSQVAEVPGNCRWVHISGQVGATAEGKLLEGFEEQARQTWHNIIGCLDAVDMDVGDIVKVNHFLTRASDVAASREIRDEMLDGHTPTSTLLVVAALAHPALLVEIEVIAAKPESGRSAKAAAAEKAPATEAPPKSKSKR